ncbi:hypothetical protein ACLMAJ_13880 [Nocardia sp. KC 131]
MRRIAMGRNESGTPPALADESIAQITITRIDFCDTLRVAR